MKIRLLTITQKVPTWVKEGYFYFAKRLPPAYAIELIEISAEKRNLHSDLNQVIAKEDARMLATIKQEHLVVALDIKGKAWSTKELSRELQKWHQGGRSVDLLIGGPDGLGPNSLRLAHNKWSLSPLTFPHALVRILVAEQIYRAFSLLQNHPYHR